MSDMPEPRPEWAEVVLTVERDRPLGDGLPSIAQILDFEEAHPGHPPDKEQRIRAELRISAPRYYQLLMGRVIDSPAALEYNPQLVHRLLGQRESRRAERAERYDRARGGE